MKRKIGLFGFVLLLVCVWMVPASHVFAKDPIILGVPTSLGFLEGKEGLACVNMAVDEINAAGGVKVGNETRPFKVIAIDARGAEPGVPVSDVIRAHKKLILEDKADFIASDHSGPSVPSLVWTWWVSTRFHDPWNGHVPRHAEKGDDKL